MSAFDHGIPTSPEMQHEANSFHLPLLPMEEVFDKHPCLPTSLSDLVRKNILNQNLLYANCLSKNVVGVTLRGNNMIKRELYYRLVLTIPALRFQLDLCAGMP